MEQPSAAAVDFLREEREPSRVDTWRMACAIYGGPELAEQSVRLGKLVAEDPVFDKSQRAYLPRTELFKRALQKSQHVIQIQKQHNLAGSGGADEELYTMWRFIDEALPIGLNLGMFIPAIEGQGTEEQAARWLPLARSFSIIGCYAQTEMGHGSNVQGLETVAEFDPGHDSFVVHSPTLTATKWWPGGLGRTATHALVYARLLTAGKDHGIHAFIVPIRSLEDHTPLPGVTVGDMGSKFGYNTMDNGFLRLGHVRIPRENMLMRYAHVSKDGVYSRRGHNKMVYGAMVLLRANIVKDAGFSLSKAVTVALRYGAVRRQFGSGPRGAPESKILDYLTHQHSLLPLLATCYAYHFVGRWMMQLYRAFTAELEAGDLGSLPEVHACTAGLKALFTQATADGIEECRRRCGGNGYLQASGLPELFASYVPAVTFEGDNTILLLQVAKYLVKAAGQVTKGQRMKGTAEYLNSWQSLLSQSCGAKTGQDFRSPERQVAAFQARSVRLVFSCARRVADAPDADAALHLAAPELVRIARAHCQLIAVHKFIEGVGTGHAGDGVQRHLALLSDLYALSLMEANMGDFLEVGALTPGEAGLVRGEVQSLLAEIRPSAVQLVDAFYFSDHYLGSAIGRYDGDVYTHLYVAAQREPLNASPVVDGIEALQGYIGRGQQVASAEKGPQDRSDGRGREGSGSSRLPGGGRPAQFLNAQGPTARL